ncbi:Zinc/iron permease [Lipomyces arxii]|uniref:Zinc/iron permease n=1 Tax=Lipomyces arxii TaxID=56418 RepID=UPI0034CE86A7
MQNMSGLITLVALSALMGMASFGAGMLPLVVSLSQERLRMVSTVGMGVLMGTSLIVIIPEGAETLYSTPGPRHARPGAPKFSDDVPPINLNPPASIDLSDGIKAKRALSYVERRQIDDNGEDNDIMPKAGGPIPSTDGGMPVQNQTQYATHKFIGVSLLAGFILMYLIDKLPAYLATGQLPHHNSVDVSELRTYSVNSGMSPTSMSDGQVPRGSGAMTTGLVIHAAADGIALGASAASSSIALETIIFFAILLHKAPAAFGMTAVLLRSGMHRRTIKQHLLVFSLAAPAGALITWVAIMIIGSTDGGTGIQWWTGILLLFSGGTFLYVAFHVMHETAESTKAEGGSTRSTYIQDTVAAIVGMLIPLITLLVNE